MRARRTAGFVSLLFATALASSWVALVLLARVTPALFPGQTLPVAKIDFPGALAPVGIRAPGPQSVFNKPIVVLVVGVDERPNQQALAAVNTDTIMLIRVDPVGKDVRALSVPRDLLINLSETDDEQFLGRVNMAFALGAGDGGGFEAGMERLSGNLERELGISIDYWVSLDFHDAAQLFDAVGGVDLTVPEDLAIDEWWYSDDDVSHRLLKFPAGPQHMDGYHAVAFARLRALDDDLHRIKRQQLVLQAAFARAFSSGAMNDPIALWSAFHSAIHTNIPSARVPGLALLAKQLSGSIEVFSLAEPVNGAAAVLDETLPSGAAVLVGVPENIQFWIDAVFGSPNENSVQDATNPPAGGSVARGNVRSEELKP